MSDEEPTRPIIVTDDMLEWLDGVALRGHINMFGAIPVVEARFELTAAQASEVLSYWLVLRKYGVKKDEE